MTSPAPPAGDQADRDVASPSPPPLAPVALTPGPRASRLEQVFTKALTRTLRANSYENFAACFPTPARHVPASLESVWRQLSAKLEESAKAEFRDIIRERDAVRGLNELDRLVGEARLRKENGEGQDIIVPHTLGAEELYQAHLAPYLQEAQSTFNSKLEAVHSQNLELALKAQNQRKEIESMLSRLEAVVSDLGNAAKASTEFSKLNNLHQEVLQIDAEFKARPEI